MATGEDLPAGHSLRARVVFVTFGPGDIDFIKLTIVQKEAATGVFSEHMAGYIKWLAGRADELRRIGRARVDELRDQIGRGVHARTAPAMAALLYGLEWALRYAVDIGAITADKSASTWQRALAAGAVVSDAQTVIVDAADPATRFLELLPALLSSGRAHLAGPDGDPPPAAKTFGWREHIRQTIGEHGSSESTELRGEGRCIGWTDGKLVWLEPETVYAEAQALAVSQGGGFGTSSRTLFKALKERGVLLRTEGEYFGVRKAILGRRVRVLEIWRAAFFSENQDPISGKTRPTRPDEEEAAQTKEPERPTSSFSTKPELDQLGHSCPHSDAHTCKSCLPDEMEPS